MVAHDTVRPGDGQHIRNPDPGRQGEQTNALLWRRFGSVHGGRVGTSDPHPSQQGAFLNHAVSQ
jgi:hypothetical protein